MIFLLALSGCLKAPCAPAGTVQGAELKSLIHVLASNPTAAIRHRRLIQLATAAAGAMQGQQSDRWDALNKQEKQLALLSAEGELQTFPGALVLVTDSAQHLHLIYILSCAEWRLTGAGTESITLELVGLLELASSNKLLKLQDVLLLVMSACSLAADASQASEFGRGSETSVFTNDQIRQLRLAMLAALQQVSSTSGMHVGCNICSAFQHCEMQ